ncbi:hypothetical protein BH18ACT5_BH18ACT5_04530 [soil metagenome]
MNEKRVRDAIEGSDTDELLRIVDGACASQEWDALVTLRLRMAEALGRGRQLWGVDQHVRYRLALEAPPPFAAQAVNEGPARFALGPLTEVAANRHTFAELAPHLHPGPSKSLVAHERVIVGEDIDEGLAGENQLELPLHLLSWEPKYATPQYHVDRVEALSPDLPPMTTLTLPESVEVVDDLPSTEALLGLVLPWLEESNGRAQSICAEGDFPAALRALGVPAAEFAPVSVAEAMSWMAWAASSGGAEGRRRGGASGRFQAWHTLATLAGFEWPASSETVTEAAGRLDWFVWSDLAPAIGWVLNIGAHDPDENLSWALGARDEA